MHSLRVRVTSLHRPDMVTALTTVVALVAATTAYAQMPAAPAPRPANQAPAPTATGPAVNEHAAALAEFQKRANAYLDLRSSLAGKLRPLSTTNDSAELATRQEALGKALAENRKGAKQGDVIPAEVSAFIGKAIAADFAKRDAASRRALLAEVPGARLPAINRIYPSQDALPTVPPLLLKELPRLPDNLQYRFFGRHVVLLDGDTQLIVDYIPNVLPPH